MISIVVVSHSHALATAAVHLASQMAGDHGPRIAVAAGLDQTTLGTDATAVAAALDEVSGPDGTLVLLDLGSALMSAEMALDFCDPEVAARVRISSAPLVEGLVAAVVTAAGGADLATVEREAQAALGVKHEQLAGSATQQAASAGTTPSESLGSPQLPAGDELIFRAVLTGPHGLHARPAAALVSALSGVDAVVLAHRGDEPSHEVDARSITAVQGLAIGTGQEFVARMAGPQAAVALRRLEELASRGFDEPQTVPPAPGPDAGAAVPAVPSDAPVHELDLAVDAGGYAPGDPAQEHDRLQAAVAEVDDFLADLAGAGAATPQRVQQDVLQAVRAMLQDPSLSRAMQSAIDAGQSAVAAVRTSFGASEESFENLANDYLRERATDLRALERLVLLALLDEPLALPEPPDGQVLQVLELDAVTAAQLHPTRTPGVVVQAPGTTGHGAMVARERGLALQFGSVG